MEVIDFVKQGISRKKIPIKKKLEESCNICFVVADSVWRDCSQLTKTEKDLLLADFAENLRREEEEKPLRDAQTKKLKRVGIYSTAIMIAIGVIVISYFSRATDWYWYAGCTGGIAYILSHIRSNLFTELNQIRHRLAEIHTQKEKYAWYWNNPLIEEEIRKEFTRLQVVRQENAERHEIAKQKIITTSTNTKRLSVPSVVSLSLGCFWLILPFLPHHISVYSTYEAVGVGALALGVIGLLRINKHSQVLRGKKESICGIILGVTLMGVNGYYTSLDITHDRIPRKSVTTKPQEQGKNLSLPHKETETNTLSTPNVKVGDKTPRIINETHRKDGDTKETVEGKPQGQTISKARKEGKDISGMVESNPQNPRPAPDPTKFYATRRSRLFHRANCAQLDTTQELISFESIEEAASLGGVPCNVCFTIKDKIK